MSMHDLQVLSPLLVLAGMALVLLLVAAFHESRRVSTVLAVTGQAVALATLLWCSERVPHRVSSLLIMDAYALFYMGLILVAGLAVTILADGYLARCGLRHAEFHIVLLLAMLGAGVLASSTHFASFFLGLEVLTVSLYVLIAYAYRRDSSLEGALKYLILAAVSSAFLLFGMALIYAESGTLEFSELAARLAGGENYRRVFVLTGTALMLAGIGFKLAVVPFHFWTPDVYQGASAPVTAFLATISKGSVLAWVLRYVAAVDLLSLRPVFVTLSVVAFASMVAGNVLALLQPNVKRMLAYGSIAHLGYMLVALLANGAAAAEAVTFYLVAYVAATVGAFGLIGHLSSPAREADRLEDFRGLFWRRPILAAMFTAMLLSLVGLPLTGGFPGKVFVVLEGVRAGLWFLVLTLAATSVIGLFYYLRIVAGMYSPTNPPAIESSATDPAASGSRLVPVLLGLLTALVLWLGVYPRPVVELIHHVVSVAFPGYHFL